MFCLDMLAIALELARTDLAYESMATKFFEHFIAIAARDQRYRRRGSACGTTEDEFYYDVIRQAGRPAAAPAGPLVRGRDPLAGGPGDRAGDVGRA